jgi:CSLREA domain-containing protein
MNTLKPNRVWFLIPILGVFLALMALFGVRPILAAEGEIKGRGQESHSDQRKSSAVQIPQDGPIFSVNTTADGDDGLCGLNHCSLREAILAANDKPNGDAPDEIRFDLSGFGSPPYTLALASALPAITDPLVLDGGSTGENCVTALPNLLVTLDGSVAGSQADGLHVSAGGSTVRGLAITGFAGDGVRLEGDGGNLLVCNAIFSNGGAGVRVADGQGNLIAPNSVFDNNGLGIDLGDAGPTANDTDDLDLGANVLQNAPVLLQAVPYTSTLLAVEGRLHSQAASTYTLQFYASPACDPSFYGEGQTYLGIIALPTGEDGNFYFRAFFSTTTSLQGHYVSATATDAEGNTSEFSQCVSVGPGNDSWPRALRLTPETAPVAPKVAHAFFDQTTDRLGQSRWYKFSVQPGSQVLVLLSDLPVNYDLTLYKDITVTYQEMFTDSLDLLNLSAQSAPDAFTPDAFTPDAFTPDAFTPDAFTPDAFTPDAFTPDAFAPDAFTPDAFTPDAFTPDAFTPDAFTPDAFTPDAFTPDAFTPDAFTPDAFTPDAFTPDAFTPDAFTPDAFTPDAFTPDAFTPDAFTPDAFTPDAFTPDAFTPDAFTPDAFTGAQTRSLIAISAFEGTASEGVVVNTWDKSGDFYVRVRGRNGAFAPETPFYLQVILISGTCDDVSDDLPDSSLTAVDENYKTLILTDMDRIAGSATEKSDLQARLGDLANRLEVAGVVVDVGVDARVAAANAQADANPECPYAKNLVADAIERIVDDYWNLNPLEYVVIVGNDDVIPFFRHPDQSHLASEKHYYPPVLDATASQASLRLGYVLSQDDYGSQNEVMQGDLRVPIPDLAVGRLAETPSDVMGVLDAYLSTPDGVLPTPDSALVTGYDFLEDAALAIQAELEAGIGTAADTLILSHDLPPTDPSAWTADDLWAKLLDQRHDLVFLSAHFSANTLLAADYETRLLADQVASTTTTMTHVILFSLGCHAGYNIVDAHDVPNITLEPDWVQAFTRQGATVIAGTGYQYGDTDFIEYNERLYLEFSRELRADSGPVSVGQALVEAKQNYLVGTPDLRGIHVKSLVQATLYGLPMLSVDMPRGRDSGGGALVFSQKGRRDKPIVTFTRPFRTNPGKTLRLRYANVRLRPDLTQNSVQLSTVGTDTFTVTATYFSGSDGVVVNPLEPVLPLEMYNVSHRPAKRVLRGVGLRSAVYDDLPGLMPLTGAPANEIRGVHVPFATNVFYPMQPWRVNYFEALGKRGYGATRLALMPAQYRSSAPGAITGTLRVYSKVGLRLYYSNYAEAYPDSGRRPALAAPPAISNVSASSNAGQVAFRVHVHGDLAAGVQEVWVTYSAVDGPLAGRWRSLDLVQSEVDSTLWEGILTPSGTTPPQDLRYIVQAVNGMGLVALDTNLGAYYTPDPDPQALAAWSLQPQETALTWLSLPDGGAFGTNATISARLSAQGTPLANQTLVFGLGPQRRQTRTDAHGVATVQLPLLGLPGLHQVSVTFAGSQDHLAASAVGSVAITRQATRLAFDAQTATATLTDATGRPLRDKTLVFEISGSQGDYARVATTNYAGRATLDASLLTPDVTVKIYFGGQVTLSNGYAVTLVDERYLPAVYAEGWYTLYLPLISKD